MPVPQFKEMRRCYSFDEVALVPGDITINPEQVNVDFIMGNLTFPLPILASAMDAVVDARFTALLSRLGGLAVLNLEGVQTRYEDADAVLAEVASVPDGEVTPFLQKVYSAPIKETLVAERIKEIKRAGAICATSVTPQNTKQFAPVAAEAGVDIFVVQSTVTSTRHLSKSYHGLVFSELCQLMPAPIIVGNCVSYSAALALMREGIAGVLVGVGPGAACTTREVLGVGVPQVTATMDCAAAREQYLKETGRYVAVITDGGIRTGGDLCKAFASGADAVMLGSVLAQAQEAPGRGFHWGMANPHPALPRGTRIRVGTSGSLEQILLGPASVTGGTQNFIGALRTAMGMCGAQSIKEMQRVEMVLAPAIKTEGKFWQLP
ncbi:MAG TPA: GuaB3 family IMP dehydrogenase-related protein [Dehalococcoidia bacterium]|nr:GuaB3 family IMP dehydrogenase-related protein [Dehalococcoidia bacterium]